MLRKQHTGFKSRLLAILFLFFNCICTASPVLKLAGEDDNDAVSTRLVQVPVPLEAEEENHASTSYINHVHHFSVRQQCDQRFDDTLNSSAVTSNSDMGELTVYMQRADGLPLPGYYAFLFRYTLF